MSVICPPSSPPLHYKRIFMLHFFEPRRADLEQQIETGQKYVNYAINLRCYLLTVPFTRPDIRTHTPEQRLTLILVWQNKYIYTFFFKARSNLYIFCIAHCCNCASTNLGDFGEFSSFLAVVGDEDLSHDLAHTISLTQLQRPPTGSNAR